MKVNFDAPLLDLDDKPIAMSTEDTSPVTLAFIAKIALNEINPQQPDPPDRKLKCFDLMLLIRKGGEVDITPEQATLLKEKIAAFPGTTPVVYGRSAALLNG